MMLKYCFIVFSVAISCDIARSCPQDHPAFHDSLCTGRGRRTWKRERVLKVPHRGRRNRRQERPRAVCRSLPDRGKASGYGRGRMCSCRCRELLHGSLSSGYEPHSSERESVPCLALDRGSSRSSAAWSRSEDRDGSSCTPDSSDASAESGPSSSCSWWCDGRKRMWRDPWCRNARGRMHQIPVHDRSCTVVRPDRPFARHDDIRYSSRLHGLREPHG